MVRPTGFEPAAFRVGAERSIQLSYGRTFMKTVPPGGIQLFNCKNRKTVAKMEKIPNKREVVKS